MTLLNQPSAPTPPPPRCSRPPCPLNVATPGITWGASQSVDPVDYLWELEAADGSIVRGRTAATNATIPLREGMNIVRAMAEDTTPEHNQSPTVELERLLYDATPPTLTLTALPPWSNAASVTLRWSASDALSGMRDYTLELQVDGGAWTTLINPSPTTEQTVSTPQEGVQYRFPALQVPAGSLRQGRPHVDAVRLIVDGPSGFQGRDQVSRIASADAEPIAHGRTMIRRPSSRSASSRVPKCSWSAIAASTSVVRCAGVVRRWIWTTA